MLHLGFEPIIKSEICVVRNWLPDHGSSVIVSNTMKWGVLAVKPPARWESFSKVPESRRPEEILLNDPNLAVGLTANAPKFHGIIL